MRSKLPFPERRRAAEISRALTKLVSDIHNQNVTAILNPRNVQRLCHGVNWRTHSGDEQAKEETSMQQHQLEHITKFDDVVQHNLQIIPSTIQFIVEGMQSQLMSTLYATLMASTDKSGNVVNAAEHSSPREAFLAMLRKIEFGVDDQGNVSMPEIHLAPGNPLLEELKKAGPEFEAEVSAITEEKAKAALQRERERVARFRS